MRSSAAASRPLIVAIAGALHVLTHGLPPKPGAGIQKRLPTYRNCLCGSALVHYAGCGQKKGTAPSLPPTKDTPHAPQSALLSMINRSAHLHRLARVCGARVPSSADAVTRARFEQEEQEWIARALEAEQVEREQGEL
jgi:hypothetical protein